MTDSCRAPCTRRQDNMPVACFAFARVLYTHARAGGAHNNYCCARPLRLRGQFRGLQNRVYKTITEDLPWELKSQNRR